MEMSQPRAGSSRLEALEQLSVEAGAEHVAVEVRAPWARVRDGLFCGAYVWAVRAGKSTLLAAPVGVPILPVGFIPVTSPRTSRYRMVVLQAPDSSRDLREPADQDHGPA